MLAAVLAAGGATPACAHPASSPTPGELVHDHTPRHGGVVGMSGSRHVEALALRSGALRFWLSDLTRKPLALDGVQGSALLRTDGAERRIELVARDGALEAHSAPLEGATVEVRLEATTPGEPVLIDFTLPVAPVTASGAAAR